jgi:glycosyltransferase involved in cell wall biosynthesis
MKILQVSTLYPPISVGGAERTAAAISRELTKEGDNVSVATTSPEKKFVFDKLGGVAVYRVGLRNLYWPFSGVKHSSVKKLAWHTLDRYNPMMGNQFERVIEKVEPDLILTHNLQGWSCSVWEQAYRHKIKVIHMLHDHSLVCPRTTMYQNNARCEKPCSDCWSLSQKRVELAQGLSGVLSVSTDLLRRHILLGAIPAEIPRMVVPNSLPPSVSVITQRRELRPASEPLRIGFMGRVEHQKGIEVLLRACELLAEKGLRDRFTLQIAGSSSDAYLNKIKRRWIGLNAQYLGHMDSCSFMDSVDVVVVPSLMNEGLGNVAFEAMARGAAVIASKLGGLTEVLEGGNAGELVPPDDAQALSEALQAFIDDRAHLSEMALKAITRATFFSPKRQMSQIREFIQSVTAS